MLTTITTERTGMLHSADTCRYHLTCLLQDLYVEIDVVMDANTPLWKAHDLAQNLQDKLEVLPNVGRAFVHVDHETTHAPVRTPAVPTIQPRRADRLYIGRRNIASISNYPCPPLRRAPQLLRTAPGLLATMYPAHVNGPTNCPHTISPLSYMNNVT